jgi:hypothetical protein
MTPPNLPLSLAQFRVCLSLACVRESRLGDNLGHVDASSMCVLATETTGQAASMCDRRQHWQLSSQHPVSSLHLGWQEARTHTELQGWSELLVGLRTSRLLLVFMRAAVHKFLRYSLLVLCF